MRVGARLTRSRIREGHTTARRSRPPGNCPSWRSHGYPDRRLEGTWVSRPALGNTLFAATGASLQDTYRPTLEAYTLSTEAVFPSILSSECDTDCKPVYLGVGACLADTGCRRYRSTQTPADDSCCIRRLRHRIEPARQNKIRGCWPCVSGESRAW